MFLLNSRAPFVIETSNLFNLRHPLYRRYGANVAEFPELRYPDTPEPSQLGALFLVMGTIRHNSFLSFFHGVLAFAEDLSSPSFHLLLTITVLQRCALVELADKPTLHSQNRQKQN